MKSRYQSFSCFVSSRNYRPDRFFYKIPSCFESFRNDTNSKF
nr:MAG TPA: hypothetical protein [Caudoviricetes sp.]